MRAKKNVRVGTKLAGPTQTHRPAFHSTQAICLASMPTNGRPTAQAMQKETNERTNRELKKKTREIQRGNDTRAAKRKFKMAPFFS